MKNRENGFYWVQLHSGRWVVCEFSENLWAWEGCVYYDKSFKQIDERKLKRDEV